MTSDSDSTEEYLLVPVHGFLAAADAPLVTGDISTGCVELPAAAIRCRRQVWQRRKTGWQLWQRRALAAAASSAATPGRPDSACCIAASVWLCRAGDVCASAGIGRLLPRAVTQSRTSCRRCSAFPRAPALPSLPSAPASPAPPCTAAFAAAAALYAQYTPYGAQNTIYTAVPCSPVPPQLAAQSPSPRRDVCASGLAAATFSHPASA
jgi:hypothetical protein